MEEILENLRAVFKDYDIQITDDYNIIVDGFILKTRIPSLRDIDEYHNREHLIDALCQAIAFSMHEELNT